MKKQLNKIELLEQIRIERAKLDTTLAGLSAREMILPGVTEEWSVKDVLAHLMEWEQFCLDWYRTGLRGATPHLPAPGMTWADLPALNRQIFEKHHRSSSKKIMTDYQKSYQQIVETVSAMPERDLGEGRFAWTKKWTLSNYIAACTCDHYRWANALIRKWVSTQKRSSSVKARSK